MKRTLALALASTLAVTATAAAKDDERREVRKAGSCGSGATSKLKLKNDDGRIEAEFEVDRNVNGEKWKVTFARDGNVILRTSKRTKAPSGSFSVERKVDDLSGADTITARGVGPSGLTCTATATLPA